MVSLAAISARAWRASLRLSLRLSGSPCIATLRITSSGRGLALGGKAHFTASLLSRRNRSLRKANSSGARSPAQPGWRSRRSPRGRPLSLGGLGNPRAGLAMRIPGKPICRGPTALATLLSTLRLRHRAGPTTPKEANLGPSTSSGRTDCPRFALNSDSIESPDEAGPVEPRRPVIGQALNGVQMPPFYTTHCWPNRARMQGVTGPHRKNWEPSGRG